LDSIDEQVRQRVATEIIEWEMGRATQPVDQHTEHSGEVGLRIIEEVVRVGDDQDSPTPSTSGIQSE
jgi:hypothetical protein